MAAISRWKVENTTDATQNLTPNLEAYDAVRERWQQKNRVAKLNKIHAGLPIVNTYQLPILCECFKIIANEPSCWCI